MTKISEVFTLPKRYDIKFMERCNKRENDMLERRNIDFNFYNRPRLEESDDDEEEEKKKEVDLLMKLLPTSKIKKNNNINCIICLSNLKIGDKESTLPCLHIFHYNCIKKWIYEKKWCPICKYEIFK